VLAVVIKGAFSPAALAGSAGQNATATSTSIRLNSKDNIFLFILLPPFVSCSYIITFLLKLGISFFRYL
jgi:hypothetical protein